MLGSWTSLTGAPVGGQPRRVSQGEWCSDPQGARKRRDPGIAWQLQTQRGFTIVPVEKDKKGQAQRLTIGVKIGPIDFELSLLGDLFKIDIDVDGFLDEFIEVPLSPTSLRAKMFWRSMV